jgi:hypothetical protein
VEFAKQATASSNSSTVSSSDSEAETAMILFMSLKFDVQDLFAR